LQLTTIMKGEHCLQDKSQIIHELLTYLAEHPDSQDTFDGIVQWWLLERKIKYQTTLVADVLTELVHQGLIVEQKKAGKPNSYRLNPQIK
jgi:hypothetical protein